MKYVKQYENILTEKFLQKEYVENKKSIAIIAKELGVANSTVSFYLKNHKIVQEDRSGKIVSGAKFNKLTTIEILRRNNSGSIVWLCECECGNKKEVITKHLKSGYIKHCGCVRIKSGKSRKDWRGFGDISGKFFSRIKKSAKKRNILFDITIQQIWELFEKQNGKCYLSGLDLCFNERSQDYSGTASLDRIDSSKGYEIENIGWCHKDINKIKHTFSIEEFINCCKIVTNFNGIFKKSLYKFTTHSTYICAIKISAKKRKLEFNITPEQIVQKFNDQGGVCAFTGLDLIYPSSDLKYYKFTHTASLDRIDNNLGYTFENVQFVNKLINSSRKDLTIQEYKYFCRLVFEKTTIGLDTTK